MKEHPSSRYIYLFKDFLCAYNVPGSTLDSGNTKMKIFLAYKALRVYRENRWVTKSIKNVPRVMKKRLSQL